MQLQRTIRVIVPQNVLRMSCLHGRFALQEFSALWKIVSIQIVVVGFPKASSQKPCHLTREPIVAMLTRTGPTSLCGLGDQFRLIR